MTHALILVKGEVMASKKVADIVREFAEPIISNLGYELVEVEYAKKSTGMNLTIFIYSEKGITLDDCETVSRALDDLLEEKDPTNGESYTFNVSSLGLDWPIKNEKDIKRNLNEEIEIKLYAPLNGKKKLEAVLVGGDDNHIEYYLLNDKEKNIQKMNFDLIAKASKLLKF